MIDTLNVDCVIFQTKASLSFNKLSRNVDYLDNDDEFYSDDHLYYKEDGYVAFSDYSVIGGEYVRAFRH